MVGCWSVKGRSPDRVLVQVADLLGASDTLLHSSAFETPMMMRTIQIKSVCLSVLVQFNLHQSGIF